MSRFESHVERQIREAVERGEFDRLPGQGEPLPGRGEEYDPLWWVKGFLERERRSEHASDVRGRIDVELGRLWAVHTEAEVRRRIADLNRRIVGASPDPAVPLDADAVVDSWKRMHRARRR